MVSFFFDLLGYIVSFPIQLLSVAFLVCIYAPRRQKFALRVAISLCAYGAVSWFFGDLSNVEWLQIDWFRMVFLLYFLLVLAVIAVCFSISVRNVLFYGVAAYVMQHICDCVWRGILSLLGFGSEGWLANLLLLAVEVVFCILFFFLFVRRLKYIELTELSDNGWLILILCVMFGVVYVLSCHVMFGEGNFSNLDQKIYAVICCFALLFLQFGLFERGRIRNEKKVLEQIFEREKEQWKVAMQNREIIERKCHDLKYQLAALRFERSRGERDSQLEEIERAISLYDSFIDTGNKALDTIFTEKHMECEHFGVSFSCMADGSAVGFMESADIYSLFGNALDNALESVCAVEEGEARVIVVKVCRRGELLCIRIDNTFSGERVFRDGLPVTTKQDKDYHGYGMRSMRYIVEEKYGGTLTASAHGGIFRLGIVIPVPAESGGGGDF